MCIVILHSLFDCFEILMLSFILILLGDIEVELLFEGVNIEGFFSRNRGGEMSAGLDRSFISSFISSGCTFNFALCTFHIFRISTLLGSVSVSVYTISINSNSNPNIARHSKYPPKTIPIISICARYLFYQIFLFFWTLIQFIHITTFFVWYHYHSTITCNQIHHKISSYSPIFTNYIENKFPPVKCKQ